MSMTRSGNVGLKTERDLQLLDDHFSGSGMWNSIFKSMK